jgi:dTDP-4-dehydrorhamnose 3,5-epimerase-like enzyme
MKQHEYFLVLDGKMKFVFQDIKTGQRKEMIVRAQAQELVRVRVGPMVSHVCWNISKKARLLSYFAYPYDIHNPETVPLNLSKEYL